MLSGQQLNYSSNLYNQPEDRISWAPLDTRYTATHTVHETELIVVWRAWDRERSKFRTLGCELKLARLLHTIYSIKLQCLCLYSIEFRIISYVKDS